MSPGPAAGPKAAFASRVALIIAALALAAGCSCNANTSLNQIYCQAYSATTTEPALILLGAFAVLAAASVWIFRRVYRPGPRPTPPAAGDAPAPAPPWRVAGLGTREPCELLDELQGRGAVCLRIAESYDGKWLAELDVPSIEPPLQFVGTWTTRELACQEAIDALLERDLIRPEEPGAAATTGS